MTADVKIYFTDPNNVETLVTGRVDGLSSLSVTFNDELTRSFSSELEFYDDGYAILKTWLLDNQNSFTNEVKVKIYDNCCNTLIIEGVILATNIDWCEPICSIKANIVEGKEAIDCLKSTIVWDDKNGFLSREQKRLRYCVDLSPTGLLIIIMVFYGILNLVLQILNLIYVTIGAIIAAIAFIVSVGSIDLFDELNNFTDAINDLNDRLVICNWYHPTALVRDYIKNACDICGVTFQSSILNDSASPYYNTLLFAAQVRKGYKPSQSTGILIGQNLPVETVETLMENHLKPLFNGEYWLVGNTLFFERKDYFDNPNNIWIDVEQLLNNGLIENDRICFSYIDKERPAFANYEYSQDFADPIGNYSGQRFNKIVEWNPAPISPNQSGKYELMFQSSQARYRGDSIERDTYETIATDPFWGWLNLLFTYSFSESIGMLLLGDHVCSNYKFLIWDEASGLVDSRVKTNYGNAFTGGTFYDYKIEEDTGNLVPWAVSSADRYNYPFVVRPENTNNLYQFHLIDNPRNNNVKKYNFDFTFNFDCTNYVNFAFTKTVRLFKNGQIVYGKVKELNINFVNRTIAVTGEV
jgi:hypothetical protein